MKNKVLPTIIVIWLALPATSVLAQSPSPKHCEPLIQDARVACNGLEDKAQCLRHQLPHACWSVEPETSTTTLSRMTVLGTGYALDVGKYPGSASVLVAEDLDFSNDIIKSLERVPGFDSGNDLGRSLGQSFSIRGWGHGNEDRVIIMQDGVRRSANLFANQTSSFGMDNELLKQVEVIRGSSSIHHGGGAIGGVIDATTKDAADFVQPGHSYGSTFHVRYDSNNSRQASAALAFAPTTRAFEFLAFAKRRDNGDIKLPQSVDDGNGGWRRKSDNDEDIETLFFKAGWKAADGHALNLSHHRYSIDVETLWNSLYHPVYSDELGPVVGTRRQTDTVLNYTAAPAGNPWLNLIANAYASENWYEREYAWGALNGTDLYYKNSDKRHGFNFKNLMQFSTGPVNHRLLLGADYEIRKENGIYVLNGVNTDFNSMPNEYNDLGLFIQHESAWFNDRLRVLLGGRYDDFDRKVQGVSENYDKSRFSPRAGASVEVLSGFNMLANYSEAFRAPSPHETSSSGPLNIRYWYQPNPDLGPEISSEYEVGFSLRRGGLFRHDGLFNLKAMYFNGEIKDMIRAVVDYGSVSPANSEYVQYRNEGRAKRHGLELEASYDTPHFGGFASFEKLDQYNPVNHHKTPYAFADKLRGGLRWRPGNGYLELSTVITHWFAPNQNPETLVSGGQTYQYVNKSFSQTDVQGRWQPFSSSNRALDGFNVLFGVNNLFNQIRRPPNVVSTSARIGLGRNVYLSVGKMF